MRIVIDISGAISAPSGLRRYIEGLLRGLAETDKRNEYLLYACFWSGNPDLVNQLNLPVQGNFKLLLRRLPQRLYLPLEERLGWKIQENWLLGHNPDVFHGAGNIIPRLGRLPSVVTFHHVGGEPDTDSGWNRFYFKDLAERSCRDAKKIIAVSEHTKNEMIQMYGLGPKKIQVVWEGGPPPELLTSDADRILAGKGPFGKFILFVSAINSRKNLMTLLRAYGRVLASGRFAHDLFLIGRKEASYDDLNAEAHKLGLGTKIRFFDNVSQMELFAFYQKADLFVYPSLMEGFGLPVVEAMTCGTPVIVANASVLPEIAGDAALYFNGQDDADLAQKMVSVLGNPELRAQLVAKGRERAQLFSWKTAAAKTLEVYRGLLP